MKDIAVLTAARPSSRPRRPLEKVDLTYLDAPRRSSSEKEKTTIIEGAGDTKEIQAASA